MRNGNIETTSACLRKRNQNFLLPYGFLQVSTKLRTWHVPKESRLQLSVPVPWSPTRQYYCEQCPPLLWNTHSKIIVFLWSTTVCQTITTILVTFVETLVTLLPLQFSFTLPIGKTVRDRALETYTEATSTHGKKESESVENWNRRNDMKNPASTLSVVHMLVSALRDSGPSGCEGDLSNMSWVFCREFSFTFPWILGLLIQTNQTLFKYKNLFKPYPANIPKSTSAALLSSSVVWAAWN